MHLVDHFDRYDVVLFASDSWRSSSKCVTVQLKMCNGAIVEGRLTKINHTRSKQIVPVYYITHTLQSCPTTQLIKCTAARN